MKNVVSISLCFLLTSVLNCSAKYIAKEFTDSKTGKTTIFWADDSSGSDCFVLQYDEASGKYYFISVESNKPKGN